MSYLGKQENNRTSKPNPFAWFLFAIVIPLTVAIALTFTILAIAGVNVGDWLKNTGKKIPVISTMITTEEEKDIKQIEEKAETTIAKKDEKINELTDEIITLEGMIDHLEQEVSNLEVALNREEREEQEREELTESKQDTLKKLSSSFKKMNHKQAALIFEDLDNEIALTLLANMSNDVRGKIFEAMDPKLAAKLTEQMITQER